MKVRAVLLTAGKLTPSGHSFDSATLRAIASQKDNKLTYNPLNRSLEMELDVELKIHVPPMPTLATPDLDMGIERIEKILDGPLGDHTPR